MKIETILFDWGGTLAHCDRQVEHLRRAANAIVLKLSGAEDAGAAESLLTFAHQAEQEAAASADKREVVLEELVCGWAARRGLHVSADMAAELAGVACRHWEGSLECFPRTVEALVELRRRGYRLGLVSNCYFPEAACRVELERHGCWGLLDFKVFSSEVGYRKPSPRIYQAALEAAAGNGHPADPSRVLFVGDSPAYDVHAPAAMGMKTALVTCFRGLWPAEDYARANPDLRIDSIAELPALLAE